MKKVGLSLFFVVALLLSTTVTAYADTTWQIKGDDESLIEERVFTDDEKLASFLSSAGFEIDEVTDSYYRHTKDWQTYNNLAEKFPLTVNKKDFIIFSTSVVKVDYNQSTNILRNTTSPVNLELTTFGIYYKNSGDKVADYTSRWEFRTNTLEDFSKPYLTKYLAFNGLALGIGIFILGVLVIFIVYYRMISRVDKLIVEEYSIENYLAKQQALAEEKLAGNDNNIEGDVGDVNEVEGVKEKEVENADNSADDTSINTDIEGK